MRVNDAIKVLLIGFVSAMLVNVLHPNESVADRTALSIALAILTTALCYVLGFLDITDDE